MKAYLTLLFAILTVLTSCGQASPEKDYPVSVDTKNSYALGEYLFHPSAKKVWVLQEYGKGKVGTAVGYFPVKEINYDKTSLIVLGKRILFKEQFPKEFDFNSLNYIDEGLFEDKNYIYRYYPDALPIQINEGSKIDISGYKRISNYVYENKLGALYFLNTSNGFGLEKIISLPQLDKNTLKHLQGQYFADKNGLYAFNARYFGDGSVEKIECIQLEKSNGKTIEPIVTRNYLVYHKSVYARYDLIEKLEIDADKMVECRWDDNQMFFFLTDGINVYEQDNSAYQLMHRNTGNNYANNFFKSGIAIQKIYNFEIMLAKDSEPQTLYFNNRKDKTGYKEVGGILVKTATGFHFAVSGPADSEAIEIKKLIIYNPITGKDEVFDEQHYRDFLKRQKMGQRINYFKNNLNKGLKDLLLENYMKFRQWYLDYEKYSIDEFNEPYGEQRLIAYFNHNMDLKTDFGNLDKNFIDELTAEFIGSYYDTTHQQNDMLEFFGSCINKWEYDKSTEMVLQTKDKDFIKLWNFLIQGRSLKDNEEFDSFTNDYKVGFINRQEYLLLKSKIEFHFGNKETIIEKYWTNSEKLQFEKAIRNSTNGSYSLIGHKPKTSGLEYVLDALNELTEENKELITAIE